MYTHYSCMCDILTDMVNVHTHGTFTQARYVHTCMVKSHTHSKFSCTFTCPVNSRVKFTHRLLTRYVTLLIWFMVVKILQCWTSAVLKVKKLVSNAGLGWICRNWCNRNVSNSWGNWNLAKQFFLKKSRCGSTFRKCSYRNAKSHLWKRSFSLQSGLKTLMIMQRNAFTADHGSVWL